ncbi:MAG: SDR family NAD(P)-dependent oxidoreductase [archaeon]|nr:SDR family NAD(P)-dependent oxidoreductase [archaeon]
MSFYKNKNVLVTGGAGFVGSHVVDELIKLDANTAITVRDSKSKKIKQNIENPEKIKIINADLSNEKDCKKAVKNMDIVLNLASNVAGIEYNIKHPGSILTENIIMNTNILEASRIEGIERFLVVSSACVYPRKVTIPTPESEGFKDSPEPTNYGYGWAKRLGEIQAKAYYEEFGMKIAIARPYNAYGPRDKYDDNTSHVIAALIKKAFAKGDEMVVWGSGKQTRSFIYVKDLAKGLLEVCEKYPVADPLNLGSNQEISIKELAEMILKISGSKKKLVLDSSYPDGQPRRASDNSKAKKIIGFEAKEPFESGLKHAIDWYKKKLII